MSKPIFESLFNGELFSARRNRKSYLGYMAAQFGLNILGIVLMLTVGNALGDSAAYFVIALWAVFAAIQFVTWCVIGQRIRDIGYSGVWALGLLVLLAIPLLNIVGAALLIATAIVPGDTAVTNKFGASQI
jgi:uncharacterized membrane protein YhaH (DUF805 family)